MEGQVPDDVKTQRMARLLNLQKKILSEIAKEYEGTIQEVLLESYEDGKLVGRTLTNRWATLQGPEELLGKTVLVRVERANPYNLECSLVSVLS
jgi:tRNA-2-methylthio-N6-dimethylallyladenosine synthase